MDTLTPKHVESRGMSRSGLYRAAQKGRFDRIGRGIYRDAEAPAADRDTFDLGRTEIEIPGSTLRIGIYSPERSIADAFRLRGAVGYELGRDALREWLRRGCKPAQLMEIASQLPRSQGSLMRTLDVLA